MTKIKVQVWLQLASTPIIHDGAVNAYIKGPLYCVMMKEDKKVYKYPIANIFRIIEEVV